MCGRMTQQVSPSEVARIFDAELHEPAELDGVAPRYNVAPTQPVTVVVGREGGRVVEQHRWGLLPSWSGRLARQRAPLINARAETVAHSGPFRQSLLRRRCIVPADGFYEWRREGGRRRPQPFLIRPADRSILAFAGLWAPWRDPASGEWLLSAAVVTTAANGIVGRLHDRMPALLAPSAWSAWLDPMLTDAGLLQALLQPAPDALLELVPVSPLVNSPHNEGPQLVEPLAFGAGVERAAPLTLFG